MRPITGFTGFPANLIIPAHGFLVLENYRNDGGGTARYRPRSSGLPPDGAPAGNGAAFHYVQNLHEVIDDGAGKGPMRPRAGPAPTGSSTPTSTSWPLTPT
jgi:hypothetical protein